MKNRFIFFIVLFIFCLCFSSCKKASKTELKFDNSEPLALAPDVRWALVTDPYAAYYASTDWNSEVKGYSRRGEILQVLSRQEDKQDNVWYRFETGWLPAASITVYSNRLKAQSAAEKLQE